MIQHQRALIIPLVASVAPLAMSLFPPFKKAATKAYAAV